MSKRYQDLSPIEISVKLIGGRWKILILWHLLYSVRRFGELKRLLPGITQKMLIQQLRELEADGLVFREVYAQVPPKVEYSLTDRGKSLRPVLKTINRWGNGFID